MTTTEHKLKLLNYLLNNNETEKYVYHPSSADIVGGHPTVLGYPNEYPNFKVRNALAQYVDVLRIKDGTYKARPTVLNGVKHATFKKAYRPLPQSLRLPKGFIVKIKNDAPENKNCFLCGGDHLQRECPYRQQQ